jgi:hypothetical protein
MYVVKNCGKFPVIIRDLNFYLAGDKEVDLEIIFGRGNIEKSSSLKKLLESGKVIVVKENFEKKQIEKKITVKKENASSDNVALLKIQNDIGELKDLIKNISVVGFEKEQKEGVDDRSAEEINKLKVANLSKEDFKVVKNFEEIGKTVEKKEELDNLLNVLNSLDT